CVSVPLEKSKIASESSPRIFMLLAATDSLALLAATRSGMKECQWCGQSTLRICDREREQGKQHRKNGERTSTMSALRRLTRRRCSLERSPCDVSLRTRLTT